MATYYVRKTGNDDTGDGSTGNPWATIYKGMLGASTTGTHVLNIGAGTYAEDVGGGCLNIGRAYESLTIQSESGLNDVILTNVSGDYNYICTAGTNVLWKNINFTPVAGTLYCIHFYLNSGAITGIEFRDCEITADSTLNDSRITQPEIYGSGNTLTVVFTRCKFTAASAGTTYPAIFVNYAGTGITFTFTDCTSNVTSRRGLYFNGGTINISGGSYFGATLPVELGVDGATGSATAGSVTGATIHSSGTHSLLIGAGTDGVIVTNNIIGAVDGDALVLKAAANPDVQNNRIESNGSNPALLIKGVTGGVIKNNVCIATSTGRAIANYDGDAAYKTGTTAVTYNKTIVKSSASLIWDASGDNAGNVVDYNIYARGNLGTVLGTADIPTIEALRTAWAAYGDGSNDSHSRLWHTSTPIRLHGKWIVI